MLEKLIKGFLYSLVISANAFAQTTVDTSVRFPSNTAETYLRIDGAAENWAISQRPPNLPSYL